MIVLLCSVVCLALLESSGCLLLPSCTFSCNPLFDTTHRQFRYVDQFVVGLTGAQVRTCAVCAMHVWGSYATCCLSMAFVCGCTGDSFCVCP